MQLLHGQVRFGINVGQYTDSYQDLVTIWKRAEDLGYEWASVVDHFMPAAGFGPPDGPCLEGLTLQAALAAETSRIHLGTMVVGNTFRNPGILAKIITTIDRISNGRFELGIGAAWAEEEHIQYGIPYHTTGRRIRMLGESVKVLRSLLTQERTTFEGRYYTFKDAYFEPKPIAQPLPIWIGGAGEQLTLRVVAESADGWNTLIMPDERYQQKVDALARHCRDVGRDPNDIRRQLDIVPAVIAATEAEVRQRAANLPPNRGLVGTPDQWIERLLGFARMGVADFIFAAGRVPDPATLELVAREVVPVVKREGAKLLPP